jgi:outer membrane protein TolC
MEAHLMLNDHRKSLQKFALVFVLVNFISSALLAQTENSPTTAVDVTEQAAQIAKTADYQFMTDDHSSATDMYSETPDEQNASDAVSVSDMSAYTIVASDSTEIATTLTIDEFWAQQASMSKISEIGSGPIQLLDTHIGDILRLALLRNRTIIGSEQQVESANAGVIQARSAHGAKLTGNFRYTRVDDVANPLVGKDSRNTYLEVAQPLFLSGRDRAALGQARLGRSSASAGLVLTRQHVLLEATLRWLGWLFAGEAERVSQKDLELAKAHHGLVSTRYKHKQVSQFEVLRAEVRLAKASSDLRKQTNARELACLDLLNVLGLPENTPVTTQDRLQMIDLPVDLVNDASEALQLREDLRIKRLAVAIARQGISGARSENQPVVSLFGQSGVADPAAKSKTFSGESYWNAGVVANLTLGDGGMRKGKIKDAQARLALAENALMQAIEQANIEIKQAYLNIETAKEVVAAQRQALKQAEEALRLAGVRYTNGLFTQVELFDAENAYLATRLQYLQAIFSYHQAYSSYRLATGQLGRTLLAQVTSK